MDSQPVSDGDGFSVELANSIAAVEEARLALLGYLNDNDVDDRSINRIEVILEEIVSNVARHSATAERVRVRANVEPDAIRLQFEDDGAPFDPLDAPDPDAFTTLAEATLGGQGIPLVRRLSRSVSYARVGTVNRVTSVVARS